jgi:hypothetical protein
MKMFNAWMKQAPTQLWGDGATLVSSDSQKLLILGTKGKGECK